MKKFLGDLILAIKYIKVTFLYMRVKFFLFLNIYLYLKIPFINIEKITINKYL